MVIAIPFAEVLWMAQHLPGRWTKALSSAAIRRRTASTGPVGVPPQDSSAFSLLCFRELWLAEDGERLRLLALFLLDSAATVGTGEKPTRLMRNIFNVFGGKSSTTL